MADIKNRELIETHRELWQKLIDDGTVQLINPLNQSCIICHNAGMEEGDECQACGRIK